jgi:hypothetical protein
MDDTQCINRIQAPLRELSKPPRISLFPKLHSKGKSKPLTQTLLIVHPGRHRIREAAEKTEEAKVAKETRPVGEEKGTATAKVEKAARATGMGKTVRLTKGGEDLLMITITAMGIPLNCSDPNLVQSVVLMGIGQKIATTEFVAGIASKKDIAHSSVEHQRMFSVHNVASMDILLHSVGIARTREEGPRSHPLLLIPTLFDLI